MYTPLCLNVAVARVSAGPAARIEGMCLARTRKSHLYIGVSRGSVLPFYRNVISAKYENSYVAAAYTSGARFGIFLGRPNERPGYRAVGGCQVGNMTGEYWYPAAHADNAVPDRQGSLIYSGE